MSRKDNVKRKSGIGAFFGGTFVGFLLGLGLVVGICAFAYFKVSPQWLNSTFKTNIDLGNEEINNKTLSDLVSTAMGIAGNMDSYTLTDLKFDFGIDLGDKFKGIDISELKNVPLSQLGGAIGGVLSSVSVAELEEELIQLSGDVEQILNSSYTYYLNINNGVLYHDEEHNDPVAETEFKYTYNQATESIEIKGKTFAVNSGKVQVGLRYLPLMTALGGFSNLKVGDVMGLKFDGTNYYNDVDGDGINDGGDEALSTVLNVIAGCKINEMPTKISSLTLAEMFDSDELSSGFFSLIDNPSKVLLTGESQGEYKSLSDAFSDAFKTSTLEDMVKAGVLDVKGFLDDGNASNGVELGEKYVNATLCQAAGKDSSVKLKTLTLPEFMAISLLGLENSGMLTDTAV